MSKEDKLNKKYRALPRGARWHLKLDADGRAYFIGRQQTLATIWGLIMLVPLSASSLMTVVLTGKSQVFHAVSALLLLTLATGCLGVRRRWLFDPKSAEIQEYTGWWRIKAKPRKTLPYSQLSIHITPLAQTPNGVQLVLLGQRHTLTDMAEALTLIGFLRGCAGPLAVNELEVYEKVTAWPELKAVPFDTARSDSAPEAESQAAKSPHTETKPLKAATQTGQSSSQYRPIWEQHLMWKLALPLPLFALLGLLLTRLGS
ncbi:hypothetical protein [Shewanella chilikensis]|uniref:hypothetical protein n=1 Tax=Shewanella chilikensis TaxID=558541 RepID=UPI001CD41CE2|nr:hypothetical protein [Shewanella chilikensis]MCA0951366.1 hypothetical protein [Shewanella chilikensis]